MKKFLVLLAGLLSCGSFAFAIPGGTVKLPADAKQIFTCLGRVVNTGNPLWTAPTTVYVSRLYSDGSPSPTNVYYASYPITGSTFVETLDGQGPTSASTSKVDVVEREGGVPFGYMDEKNAYQVIDYVFTIDKASQEVLSLSFDVIDAAHKEAIIGKGICDPAK
jgi:hypothetical protein